MARQTFPSDVPREQFETVREMLEAARRKTRPRKHDLYDVFCAVLYFLHTGRNPAQRRVSPSLRATRAGAGANRGRYPGGAGAPREQPPRLTSLRRCARA